MFVSSISRSLRTPLRPRNLYQTGSGSGHGQVSYVGARGFGSGSGGYYIDVGNGHDDDTMPIGWPDTVHRLLDSSLGLMQAVEWRNLR